MKKGDTQLGLPQVVYTDTQANIEALAGIVEGAHAYATDTDEPGWYDGATWVWGAGGGAPTDHDHSGDAGDGGQFDANHLLSTGASDGDIYTADGSGNTDFEPGVDIGTDAADIDAINVNEQVADPAQPGAGHRLIFAKDDGIYEEDDAGVVTGPFGAGGGADPDAIHVNIDNEISGIANKATPIAGDLIVIEDSEDGFNKKSVDINDLPGSAATGHYRMFAYNVDSGDIVFLTDEDDFPLFMLLDLE